MGMNTLHTNSTSIVIPFAYEGMSATVAATVRAAAEGTIFTALLGMLLNLAFGGLLQATWILMNNL